MEIGWNLSWSEVKGGTYYICDCGFGGEYLLSSCRFSKKKDLHVELELKVGKLLMIGWSY
jgi:hypothetical protein